MAIWFKKNILTEPTTEDSLQRGYVLVVRYQFSDVLCLCAADEGKDQYEEESEVTTCETRADKSFLLQKPVTRVKLEARADSRKVTRSQ